jgi:hypothetical protein
MRIELSMLYESAKTVSEKIMSDISRRVGGAVHRMVYEGVESKGVKLMEMPAWWR